MSKVAEALGTAPMSLYRYVTSKDELFALMIDATGWHSAGAGVNGRWLAGRVEPVGPALPGPVAPAPLDRAGADPYPADHSRQIAWMESGLISLRGTPLTGARRSR
jgi:hypothetical protein